MWTYNSLTGRLDHDEAIIATAYSGNGEGLNNPAMEADKGIGPIPRGQYHIGPWEDMHPHLGPQVAPLTPVGHDALGRTEFFVHGDSSAMNHTASHGCIIAGRPARDAMRASGETELMVI